MTLRLNHPVVPVLLLALVAVLPYTRGLAYPFVYDDLGSIAENSFLQEPGAWGRVLSGRTLTDPAVPDGRRPAVVATYLLDRALWGLRPAGYHAGNLLLHAGCALLFYGLLRRLTGGRFIPFGAALLFALHPVNVEAVQSPAFREDLLVGLFGLAFLLAACRRDAWGWLAVPLLALALLSKESAVAFVPLLGWVWLCFPEARPGRARMAGMGGAAAALALGAAVLWWASGSVQALRGGPDGVGLAFPRNLWTAPALWLMALRRLALPWPLLVDHVVDPVDSWLALPFLAGWAVWAGWIAAAFALRRRAPDLALALGWMLLAFLPVSNVVPLFNPFAERYLHLLAPGAGLLAAGLLARAPSPRTRAVLLAALAAAGAALILARLPDWSSNEALWRKTLEQEPRSARAHTWVALDLKHRGAVGEARRLLEEADRLNPQDTSALINLAVLAGQEGDLASAVERLREATRRRPDKADGWWNLAVALHQLGREEEAAEAVRRTLEADPRHPAARAVTAPAAE
ncbi:MAG TPA: tetratricopeptide repeat protein [Kiritimatiellia bacterium]|nr:tetratricopeptide repeat protein [Kiritimatiellia bacterium]HRZ10849.1 tetratricopeptide repeat protein [Kiritimatiellia bacterium]HSA18878.1 tetratricopeptide repeat protein [Kiritimatiellia bacterium]